MEDEGWEKKVMDILTRRESALCHSVNAIDKIDLVGILLAILPCYFTVQTSSRECMRFLEEGWPIVADSGVHGPPARSGTGKVLKVGSPHVRGRPGHRVRANRWPAVGCDARCCQCFGNGLDLQRHRATPLLKLR